MVIPVLSAQHAAQAHSMLQGELRRVEVNLYAVLLRVDIGLSGAIVEAQEQLEEEIEG